MSKKKHKANKSKETSTISAPNQSLPEQPFPTLGHQLRATPCTNNDLDGWIKIAPTPAQRLRTFITAFATGFILATVFMLFIYLPDIIADYAHRSESFLNFLTFYLVAAVGLISVFSAFSAILRDTVCHIHPQKRLILLSSRINQEKAKNAPHIDDLPMLDIISTGLVFKRDRIFTADGNMQKPIAETAGDQTDINALYEWMKKSV